MHHIAVIHDLTFVMTQAQLDTHMMGYVCAYIFVVGSRQGCWQVA